MATRSGPTNQPRNCHSTLWFLEDDDLYKTVKPYRLCFVPEEGFPITNVKRREVKDVLITDIRGLSAPPSLEQNGFQVFSMPASLTASSSSEPRKIQECFLNPLKELLSEHFQTPHVLLLEYKVIDIMN